jgi:hypothetical protein
MCSIYDEVPLDRDISSTNIRVSRSLTRESKGRKLCKVRELTLQENYRAVSYAWGPPDAGESILLNSTPFEVRKYLWNFLNEACTYGVNVP